MANIGGQKIFIPRPPDKGSFPLDHDSECKTFMIQYMKCLKDTECDGSSCRPLAKEYLQCRMDRDLMTKEEWKLLGFKDSDHKTTTNKQ